MEKKELRQAILRLRDELSPEEREIYSCTIRKHVESLPVYREAQIISYFVSFKSEVDMIPLIRQGLAEGKRVLLPIADGESRKLIFSELRDFDTELSLSTYGILEPKKEFLRPVAYEDIELVLTPGVVFDRLGYRIGYGGGYYDRFLGSLSVKPPTVAIAFDLQVADGQLPREEFDMPVDQIITERRTIPCADFREVMGIEK